MKQPALKEDILLRTPQFLLTEEFVKIVMPHVRIVMEIQVQIVQNAYLEISFTKVLALKMRALLLSSRIRQQILVIAVKLIVMLVTIAQPVHSVPSLKFYTWVIVWTLAQSECGLMELYVKTATLLVYHAPMPPLVIAVMK